MRWSLIVLSLTVLFMTGPSFMPSPIEVRANPKDGLKTERIITGTALAKIPTGLPRADFGFCAAGP
jgi:hypothetical protein